MVIKHYRKFVIVYYDTCDLSGPLLHVVRLAPERSEGAKRRAIMSHLSHEYRILFYSSCVINPPYSYFIYLCIFNCAYLIIVGNCGEKGGAGGWGAGGGQPPYSLFLYVKPHFRIVLVDKWR